MLKPIKRIIIVDTIVTLTLLMKELKNVTKLLIAIIYKKANQWEIILDNNSSGVLNFNGTAEYLNSFYIATNRSDTNYSYYIDALGFSWDDEYTVGDNINNWEIVSTLPSDWFEGESLNVGAQAKYMTRGWVDISWTMYDVIKSIFLQDDFLLLMVIEELGYNETEINNNYT
ncbi:unnamed protein product, partial [marine sediment metagenome]